MQRNSRLPRFIKLAITGVALSWLAGCGGGGGGDGPSLPDVSSAKALTNTSADNYDHNRWGLIEAATLQTYADNWKTADTADSSPTVALFFAQPLPTISVSSCSSSMVSASRL